MIKSASAAAPAASGEAAIVSACALAPLLLLLSGALIWRITYRLFCLHVKTEWGLVSDVHDARPELRTQQTSTVLSRVGPRTHGTWKGRISGCLQVMGASIVTTEFIWMMRSRFPEYVKVLWGCGSGLVGCGVGGGLLGMLGLLRHRKWEGLGLDVPGSPSALATRS